MSTITVNPSLSMKNRAKADLRLTPRGRFVARLAVVASLSILLLSAYSALTGATAGSEESSQSDGYVKVSVKPGETLWSIASRIDPQGDAREIVDEIMQINNLQSPRIEAGEKIFLPTR